MGATLATVSAITKEIYEGDVREQMNNEVKMLRRIEKTSKGTGNDIGGRYVTFPIHTTRNTGIGARNELEALPVAGQQGSTAARIGLKYQYGAIQLTGQSMKLVDKNYQAFQSALEMELKGIKKDLARDLNRQCYGDGRGVIGSVTATTAGNTITVDRPDLFDKGMAVDYILANNTLSVSNRTVTAINTAAKTITISGAAIAAPAVGDYFVRTGNLNREWTGLASIVKDTGILYNVDASLEPLWRSVVNNNSGTPTALSESMLTKMADDIDTNGGDPSVIFTTKGVRRSYANLLMQQRQFVNTKEFTGGFGGLAFITDRGEIPMVTDNMAPPGTTYFLDESAIKLYREEDWSFMDEDGSKWARVPGYDAYGATLYQYSEIGTDRRNAHGVISNIIEQ